MFRGNLAVIVYHIESTQTGFSEALIRLGSPPTWLSGHCLCSATVPTPRVKLEIVAFVTTSKIKFHFIISGGTDALKGCGRPRAFGVIARRLGLLFSPFSPAASSEGMAALEG